MVNKTLALSMAILFGFVWAAYFLSLEEPLPYDYVLSSDLVTFEEHSKSKLEEYNFKSLIIYKYSREKNGRSVAFEWLPPDRLNENTISYITADVKKIRELLYMMSFANQQAEGRRNAMREPDGIEGMFFVLVELKDSDRKALYSVDVFHKSAYVEVWQYPAPGLFNSNVTESKKLYSFLFKSKQVKL